MFKSPMISILTVMLCVTASTLQAAKKERPGDVAYGDDWKVAPLDWDFGNHIDTHIQLKYDEEDGEPEELWGSFYIIFTDDKGVSLGTDEDSGLPIARHPRGLMFEMDGETVKHDERCGVSENIVCEVGWYMDGVPGVAKFVSHSGVNMNDHPLWLTNRSPNSNADIPGLAIPQPGSYSHFHWITPSGDDPRPVPEACDQQMAGKLQGSKIEDAAVDVDGVIKVKDSDDVDATAGWTGQTVHSGLAETSDPAAVASAEDVVCPGWYLQIEAVQDFAFQHGGEIIPVYSGMDLRTHLNLITNHAIVPGLTTTRPKDMNGGGGGH